MKSFKSFTILFILLFAVWLLLTSTTRSDELLTGLIVSIVIAIVLAKFSQIFESVSLSPKSLILIPVYLVIFLWEMIKSNIDVALRVINPKLPINPGIVKIKTNLKSPLAKLILANSITLTPGTLTLDVKGDYLYIHWIDVKDEDIIGATEDISKKFEKTLKEIVQ